MIAHQPSVTVISTPVGARYQMRCSGCTLVTPPMSKQGAELAAERHGWETEPGARSANYSDGPVRRSRSV
jgi:hypothetical protein